MKHGATAASSGSRCGGGFELFQVGERVALRVATHGHARFQTAAHRRALGAAEEAAAVLIVELHAAHAGRFAVWHAGDGRADGRGDAAGGAVGAAVHGRFHHFSRLARPGGCLR
jgi:hypothetical protein